MDLFQSNRLSIRSVEEFDKELFIELITAPEIIDPIPDKNYGKAKSEEIFLHHLNNEGEILDVKNWAWGICIKGEKELIGLCLFLTDSKGEREIGYRFRKKFWNNGYGKEVTKSLIEFSFEKLKVKKLTAEVNIKNTKSIKILERFMQPESE